MAPLLQEFADAPCLPPYDHNDLLDKMQQIITQHAPDAPLPKIGQIILGLHTYDVLASGGAEKPQYKQDPLDSPH